MKPETIERKIIQAHIVVQNGSCYLSDNTGIAGIFKNKDEVEIKNLLEDPLFYSSMTKQCDVTEVNIATQCTSQSNVIAVLTPKFHQIVILTKAGDIKMIEVALPIYDMRTSNDFMHEVSPEAAPDLFGANSGKVHPGVVCHTDIKQWEAFTHKVVYIYGKIFSSSLYHSF